MNVQHDSKLAWHIPCSTDSDTAQAGLPWYSIGSDTAQAGLLWYSIDSDTAQAGLSWYSMGSDNSSCRALIVFYG